MVIEFSQNNDIEIYEQWVRATSASVRQYVSNDLVMS